MNKWEIHAIMLTSSSERILYPMRYTGLFLIQVILWDNNVDHSISWWATDMKCTDVVLISYVIFIWCEDIDCESYCSYHMLFLYDAKTLTADHIGGLTGGSGWGWEGMGRGCGGGGPDLTRNHSCSMLVVVYNSLCDS